MQQNQIIIPIVDDWKPNQEDIIFTNGKNIVIAPLNVYFHLEEGNNKINYFMVNAKKSYNSDELRNHTCLYLNYFEKYYDQEKEYFTNLANIKFLIDAYPEYNMVQFMNDICKYILQPSIFAKTKAMVDHNYTLSLSYKSANNPQLQYTDEHAKALMHMSILMNLCIPLITHFAFMRRVSNIDEFLLNVYDKIMYADIFSHVNIPAKLYETSISNVSKNEKNNAVIWAKQDIRGKDVVTHSMSAVRNIILNIMPKYTFDKSMVSLNYTSIQKNNKFQITDIAYEFTYIPLSSSKRDGEDNASEFDKYEVNLTKASENLYMQSKVNCQETMKKIEQEWGPFNQDEIEFYMRELRNDNGEIINSFQRQLIFNLFYKYFGDTSSINAINAYDYIKLMLIAKKMLRNNMMAFLPFIISSKFEKVVSRQTLNKKEKEKMEKSQYFPLVLEKYKNEKIQTQILGTIASMITSTFKVIDFNDPESHGKIITPETDIIIEEALLYILLI